MKRPIAALLASFFLLPSAEAVPVPGTVVVEITPDLRDCVWPVCGGWFVSRVNHANLRCIDGSLQPSCYVLEIDWAALGLDPAREQALTSAAYRDEVLLRARGGRVNVPGFGDFYTLTPVHAWTQVVP